MAKKKSDRNKSGKNGNAPHPSNLDVWKKNPDSEGSSFSDSRDPIDAMMQMLSPDEKELAGHLLAVVEHGVTPEAYAQFYSIIQMMSGDMPAGKGDGYDEAPLIREPLADAAEKTLVLKVQMKDVSKPPMWREIEVPAEANFFELHHIIQIVMGFEDRHLWQFTDPSDRDIIISDSQDDSDSFMDRPGLDADETFLTSFFREKGDKMDYEYDFGDSWELSVQLKEIRDGECECPRCVKYKGDLNPPEDSGGVWAYLTNRESFSNWATLSKAQRKKNASEMCFDSPEEYYDWLSENIFILEIVNADLASFWDS